MSQDEPEAAAADTGSDTARLASELWTEDVDVIDLAPGTELDENEARALAVARANRLIVIAGPASSGKTTLVVSIYELFQWRAVPDWLFSGCATFRGFELRSHPSRIASERGVGHTDRTLNTDDKVRYLHLQVAPQATPHQRLDLFFTDVAGELFERARDSVDECRQLTFISRADHFVLLLDGQKLAVPNHRYAAVQEGEMLLRTCLESGVLGRSSFVEVLFAKSDYLIGAETSPIRAACEQIKADFRERFETRLGRLIFDEVAARPEPASGLQFGYGVPKLVSRWASSSPRIRPLRLTAQSGAGTRESEAFLKRQGIDGDE